MSSLRLCALALALLFVLAGSKFTQASEPQSHGRVLALDADTQVDDSDRPQPAPRSVIPRLIRFSGQLPPAQIPNPSVAAGTRLVTFALYAQQQGGEPLWSETQVINADNAGRYTVMLGSTIVQGVPIEAFSSGEGRWLSVTIEGEPEQPRLLLVSVPYALKAVEAENLGGKPASEFVTKSDVQLAVQQSVAQAMSTAVAGANGAQSSGGLDDSHHGDNALARVQPGVTQQGVTGAGATSFSDTSGNEVVFVNQSGTGMGVNAATTGTVAVNGAASGANGTGVRGASTSTSGSGVGVSGNTAAANGQGVVGTASSLTGTNTGVLGQSSSAVGVGVAGVATGATGVAVLANAASPTGNSIAIEATDFSPTGVAAVLNVVQPSAMLLEGQQNGQNVITIDGHGNLISSGTVTAAKFIGDGSGLTGLSGVAGPQGPPGPQGPQGQTGPTGATGAQGPVGSPGPIGIINRGAWNANASYKPNDAVNDQGSYWLAVTPNSGSEPSTNNTNWQLVAAQGSQGPAGAVGATGPQGPAGPAGATGATGSQGPAGPAGQNGAPGPQGPIGITNQGVWNAATSYIPNDAVSDRGSYWLALKANADSEPSANNANWQLVAQQGSQGPTGPQGTAGAVGATGPQGPAGPTGATGLIGPIGPAGPAGSAGAQGPAGPIGITNRGVWSPATNYNPNDAVSDQGAYWLARTANIQSEPSANNSNWQLIAAQGSQGPAGAQGPAGSPGPAGPSGPAGATGSQGPPGPAGQNGASGPQGPIGPIGPAGPTGPAGAQGPPGPVGISNRGVWNAASSYNVNDAVSDQGSYWLALKANADSEPSTNNPNWQLISAQGATGPAGAPGANGPQGPPGPAGAPGAQGPIGPAGASPFSLIGNNAVYTAGSVGVGTPTPNAPFEVDGNGSTNTSNQIRVVSTGAFGPDLALFSNGPGGHIFDLVSTGSSNVDGAGNFAVFDSTAQQTRLEIGPTGSIGLGTSANQPPVSGSDPNPRVIVGNAPGSRTTLRVFNNNGDPGVPNGDANLELVNQFRSWTVQSQTGGAFQINDNTAGATRLHIESNGNVGVGTSTPAFPLDVNGTVHATTFKGDGSQLTGIASLGTSNIFVQPQTFSSGSSSPVATFNSTGTNAILVGQSNGQQVLNLASDGTLGVVANAVKSANTITPPAVFLFKAPLPILASIHDTNNSTTAPGAGLVVKEDTQDGLGIYAETTVTNVPSTSNGSVAVSGVADDPFGAGVFGYSPSITNDPTGTGIVAGGFGVLGQSDGPIGVGVGAVATGQNGVALIANANGSSGIAARLRTTATGTLIRGQQHIGPGNNVKIFNVDGSGNVQANSYLDLNGNPLAASLGTSTAPLNNNFFGNENFSANSGAATLNISQTGAGPGIAVSTSGANSAIFATTGGSGSAVSGTVNNNGSAITGQNNGTGMGVTGIAPTQGVYGTATATTGFSFGVQGVANSPGGLGVLGFNNAASGGIGVQGTSLATSGGVGVSGSANATTGNPIGVQGDASHAPLGVGVFGSGTHIGVQGTSTNSVDGSSGIAGSDSSSTGVVFGVSGSVISPTGVAVQGNGNGEGSAGVRGFGNGTTAFNEGVAGFSNSPAGAGVHGNNLAAAGSGVGVLAEVQSPNGQALQLKVPNSSASLVTAFTGTGSTLNKVFNLDGAGNMNASGTVTAAHFVGDGSGLTNLPGGTGGGPASFVGSNATQIIAVTQTGTGAGVLSTVSGPAPAIQATATGTGTAGIFKSAATIVQALNATGGEVLRADQGGIAIGQGQEISQHLSTTATLQIPQGNTGRCIDFPVNVPGAADGDTVALGVPASLASLPNVQITGFVGAPGSVTVRGCAGGGGTNTANPPPAQVRVDVWKHSNSQDGTITGNVLQVDPANVSFSPTAVGITSNPVVIALTNIGTGTSPIALAIGSPSSAEFILLNSCSTSLAANTACTLVISFTPNQSGLRSATLKVTSTQTINLSGNGVGSSLLISPGTINFGAIAVGSFSTQTISLNNNSAGPIAFSFSPVAAPFSTTTNCGASLLAQSACSVFVKFLPTVAGPQTSSITFTDNSGNPPQTVNLQGSGGQPLARLSISSLTFGNSALNVASAPQTATLSNVDGNATLQITSISTNNGDFAITSNTCGTSLSAGATCLVTVVYTPSVGGSKSATLTFLDNSSGNPGSSQTVSLFGTGNAAISTLNRGSFQFGTQAIGLAAPVQQLTVSNTGGDILAISSITIGGDFQILGTSTCPISSPGNLSINATCVVNVTFTPTVSGTRGGTLTITSNTGGTAGTPQALGLSGTGGVSNLIVSPGALGFPTVGVNTSTAPMTELVTNNGSAALNFVSAPSLTGSSDFSILGGTTCLASTVLQPGQNCDVMVAFTPTAAVARSATLVLTTDNGGQAGSKFQVGLSGTGLTSAVRLTTNVTSFGVVMINGVSSTLQAILSNTGGAVLNISANPPIGFDNPDFVVAGNNGNCTAVAPGTNCTISITFKPSQIGFESGVLTFTDDAGGIPGSQQRVSFSGSGDSPLGRIQADITNLYSPSCTTSSCTALVSPTLPSTPSEILLTNDSGAPLTIFHYEFPAPTNTQFSITSTTCPSPTAGGTLAPNATCSIFVTYTPTTTTNVSASLNISDNHNGSPSSIQRVSFQGISFFPVNANAPSIQFSRNSMAINAPQVGTHSIPQEEVVTNIGGVGATGGTPLSITNISFSPSSPLSSLFTVTSDQPGCDPSKLPGTPITIGTQQSCTFQVTYTPTQSGSPASAQGNLVFTDNASGAPHNVPISGSTGAPTIALSPCCGIGFSPALNVGQAFIPVQLEISNSGGGPLLMSNFALTGSTDFGIRDNSCSGLPSGLQPAASCLVTFTFTPTSSGTKNATFTVTSNTGGQQNTLTSTTLSAGAAQPNFAGPGSLGFSTVNVGASNTQLYTVSNNGGGPLVVTSIAVGSGASDFSINGAASNCGSTPVTIAPGASCTLALIFAPSKSGSRAGTLTFIDNDGGTPGTPQNIPLSGFAPQPNANICCSLGFATTQIGVQSAAQTITANNNGGDTLVISGVTVTPPGDFTINNGCAAPLAPGANCYVNVSFKPTASGSRTATVTFTDNDNGITGSQQLISVSGTGGTPAASLGAVAFFSVKGVGNTRDPQQTSLTNTGLGPLAISGIATTGDFAQTNNCPVAPATLSPNQVCTIVVTFTPTALGSRVGSLNVTSNSGGSPNTITSTGLNATAN